MFAKTCSSCGTVYDSIKKLCPKCGCPIAEGDYSSDEQADAALRHWFESVAEDDALWEQH